MLETFESRVSRIEKQGFLEYAKSRKGFEEMIYFSKEEQYRHRLLSTFENTSWKDVPPYSKTLVATNKK